METTGIKSTIITQEYHLPEADTLPVLGNEGIFNTALIDPLLTRSEVATALGVDVHSETTDAICAYTATLRVYKVRDTEALMTILHPRNTELIGAGNFGRIYRPLGADIAIKLGIYNPFSSEGHAVSQAIYNRHWNWPREQLKRLKFKVSHPIYTVSKALVGPLVNKLANYINLDLIDGGAPKIRATTDRVTLVWRMIDEICGAFVRREQLPGVVVPLPKIIFVNEHNVPFCYAMDYVPEYILPGHSSRDVVREANAQGLVYYDGTPNIYFTMTDQGVRLCAVDPEWGVLKDLNHSHKRKN